MTITTKSDSPCINVCTLDSATQMCIGCFRTIQEISDWITYSDRQRAKINGELAARRATYFRDGEVTPNTNQGALPNAQCEQCGAAFGCGMSNPDEPCWCARLPNVVRPSSDATCLCPTCLVKLIDKSK